MDHIELPIFLCVISIIFNIIFNQKFRVGKRFSLVMTFQMIAVSLVGFIGVLSLIYYVYVKKYKDVNKNAHKPVYETAHDPTFTFCMRNRFMYQRMYDTCNNISKNNERIKILILGPGCYKTDNNIIANFSPEFMEIRTILNEFKIDFCIIDKDKQALKCVKNNVYYMPPLLNDISIQKKFILNKLCKLGEPMNSNNSRYIKLNFINGNHSISTINCDFIDINLENKKYDIIIANNCLFFAFNHNKLKGNDSKQKYLFNLLSCLNGRNGILFVDIASLKMINNISSELTNNGYVLTHLGWRNYFIQKQ